MFILHKKQGSELSHHFYQENWHFHTFLGPCLVFATENRCCFLWRAMCCLLCWPLWFSRAVGALLEEGSSIPCTPLPKKGISFCLVAWLSYTKYLMSAEAEKPNKCSWAQQNKIESSQKSTFLFYTYLQTNLFTIPLSFPPHYLVLILPAREFSSFHVIIFIP